MRNWFGKSAVVCALTLLAAACASSKEEDSAAEPVESVETAPTTEATGGGTTEAAAAAKGGGCGTAAIVVGLDTDPVQLDPQQLPQTLGAYTVLDAVYDTLASYVDGKPAPRLAESWTESSDRLTWTIKIRRSATFSDGSPVTAVAVKQSLNAQSSSTVNGPALSNVSFVDAPDDATVTVKLKSPWSAFPHVLTSFYTSTINPKALASGDLTRQPAGSGPFTLTDWKPNDRLTLTCNPNYWGVKPKVGTLEFRFIPDEVARLAALKAGDIDAAWLLTKDSIEGAQGDARFATFQGPYSGQSVTLLNNSSKPLNDVGIRTALVKAVDNQALFDAFATPGSEDTFGPFPKKHPSYAEAPVPVYDPDGAKKLVADWSAANGGAKPAVTFSYTAAGNQLIDDVIAATADYWTDAGFDVKLDKQADATGFVTNVVLGNYQVAGFVAALSPDPDLTLYNALHQLGAFNFAKYRSAPLSDLLDKGRRGVTDAERKAAYDAAQQVIAKDVPVLFGSFSGAWVAASKRVTGMEQFTTFVFPTRAVGLSG